MHTFDGQTYPDAWTAELAAPGPFGRTAAAELTGNGLPDAVLLDGTRATLLVDPDATFAPIEVPLAADDLCVLPGHLADGRGVIVLVNSAGLWLCPYAFDTCTFTSVPAGLAAWAGARRVTPIDRDGSGRSDLAGVASDGRTVLFATAGASEHQFLPGNSFMAAADVLDLLALQWIAGGAQEIAILTSSGLFVHDGDGAQLASFASILPGGTIARIRQQGTSTDRLTWITTYAPPAQQWLFTLAPNGVQGQLDVGQLDVVASLGADFDRDGDDDLMVSHRFSYNLVYFENQRSPVAPAVESFTYDPARTRLFRVGPANQPAAENRAWPALADFDGDLDIDIVFPCEYDQRALYMRGDWINQDLYRPTIQSGFYEPYAETVILRLGAPAALVAPTHLEIGVWHQPDFASSSEQAGIDRVLIPWPSSWPADVSFQVTGLSSNPTHVHSAHIRGVYVHSGKVIAALPARVGKVTRDAWIASQLEAEPYSGARVGLTVLQEDPQLPVLVVPTSRARRFKKNKPPASYVPPSQQN